MNIRQTRFLSLLILFLFLIMVTGCGPGDNQPRVMAVKGQPAPDFTLTDLHGKDWSLSALRGKVVFVNFWATWCPPCLEEMPSMAKLYERMSSESFQMLAILYNDRPEMGQSLVNKAGFTFPVLIDPDSSVAKKYGLTGVPETFIIDTEGILREKFIGPFDWNSQGALQVIEKYLPSK